MTWTNKVTWTEGLFLRPQLFQQQERYLENFAHKRALPLSPFFWGFSKLYIDPESLTLGKLVVAEASGIYADGTPFDIPGQTPPPTPLTFKHEHIGQTIHLALAIRIPNSEETSFDDVLGSTARNSVFDAQIRDSNSVNQGAQGVHSIQLSHLRLVLIPEKELTSAWMGLPITKLTALKSDGSAELENHIIAPVNRYGASAMLSQWVSQLHGTLKQRLDQLATRLSGSNAQGGAQSAEVSDFLMLQTLNRYEPQLDHLLRVKETPPDQVYVCLRGLSSELSTFVRVHSRKANPVPAYQHMEPYSTFRPLIDDTRELLNNLLIRSAQSIPLEAKSNGMYLASIDPSDVRSFSHLVLAVSADIPADQIAQQFAAHGKLAPSDRLPELVRLHLPGIALRVLPVPPRQIPFNAACVYFQLEPTGPHWEHLQNHGGVGLHVGKAFANLRIELWGVR